MTKEQLEIVAEIIGMQYLRDKKKKEMQDKAEAKEGVLDERLNN